MTTICAIRCADATIIVSDRMQSNSRIKFPNDKLFEMGPNLVYGCTGHTTVFDIFMSRLQRMKDDDSFATTSHFNNTSEFLKWTRTWIELAIQEYMILSDDQERSTILIFRNSNIYVFNIDIEEKNEARATSRDVHIGYHKNILTKHTGIMAYGEGNEAAYAIYVTLTGSYAFLQKHTSDAKDMDEINQLIDRIYMVISQIKPGTSSETTSILFHDRQQ